MKNTAYARIFLLSFLTTANIIAASAQNCTWARKAGGSRDAKAVAVVTDASGNVYVTGSYDSDTMYFGTSYIVNTDTVSADIYFAKYDSAGTLLWVKSFGGSWSDNVSGMSIDAWGDIYITGTIEGPTAAFGSVTLTIPGGAAIFLAKLNSSGNTIWAKIAGVQGSTYFDAVTGITTDAPGNVYITGYFQDSITFGATTFVHTLLGNGVFVAKFDSSGNTAWAKCSNGAGDDSPSGIATDAAGNVYVTGSWTSTSITFDALTLTDTIPDIEPLFLVKYSSSGTALWAKSVGDSNFVESRAIMTDMAGNVIITGNFNSPTVTFGSTTLTNADITGNSNDIFLVKYSPAGNVIWAKQAGGSSEDISYSLFVDAAGSIYTGGMFTSPSISFGAATLTNFGMYLVHFNSSGDPVWAKSGASYSSSGASSIYKDAYNHLYVTGGFNAFPLTLDAITLTNPDGASGYIYSFLARYDNVSTEVPGLATSENKLLLFPNPASTELSLQSTETISHVIITNLLGQRLLTRDCNAKQVVLDIANLSSGVYLLTVNGTEVRKFVKE